MIIFGENEKNMKAFSVHTHMFANVKTIPAVHQSLGEAERRPRPRAKAASEMSMATMRTSPARWTHKFQ